MISISNSQNDCVWVLFADCVYTAHLIEKMAVFFFLPCVYFFSSPIRYEKMAAFFFLSCVYFLVFVRLVRQNLAATNAITNQAFLLGLVENVEKKWEKKNVEGGNVEIKHTEKENVEMINIFLVIYDKLDKSFFALISFLRNLLCRV
jgi:hypothetical protein